MKRWMKKFTAVVATAAMVCSVGMPAFAAEEGGTENLNQSKIVSETVIDLPHQEPVKEQITRAGDVEYKRVLEETKSFTRKYIGPAGGQPSNGTVFETGGGFYWNDGGNNVSVSFGLSTGPVSLSVSVGKVGGTTGIYAAAPTNKACKLQIYKDITVYKYALYKRPAGSTSWTLDTYQYGQEATRVYPVVELV